MTTSKTPSNRPSTEHPKILIPHVHPAQGRPDNWDPNAELYPEMHQRPPRKPHTTTHRHIERDVDPDIVLHDEQPNNPTFGRPRIGVARTAETLQEMCAHPNTRTGSDATPGAFRALKVAMPLGIACWAAVIGLIYLGVKLTRALTRN